MRLATKRQLTKKYYPVRVASRAVKNIKAKYLPSFAAIKHKPVQSISLLTLGMGLLSGVVIFYKMKK